MNGNCLTNFGHIYYFTEWDTSTHYSSLCYVDRNGNWHILAANQHNWQKRIMEVKWKTTSLFCDTHCLNWIRESFLHQISRFIFHTKPRVYVRIGKRFLTFSCSIRSVTTGCRLLERPIFFLNNIYIEWKMRRTFTKIICTRSIAFSGALCPLSGRNAPRKTISSFLTWKGFIYDTYPFELCCHLSIFQYFVDIF